MGRKRLLTPKERRCIGCTSVLNISEFYSHKGMPGGKAYYCKKCLNRRSVIASIKRRLQKIGQWAFIDEIRRAEEIVHTKKRILYKMMGIDCDHSLMCSRPLPEHVQKVRYEE